MRRTLGIFCHGMPSLHQSFGPLVLFVCVTSQPHPFKIHHTKVQVTLVYIWSQKIALMLRITMLTVCHNLIHVIPYVAQ